MNKTKYDEIVRPFAIARQTPYTKKSEYSHLIEEPKEILITSAYYKSLWWYDELTKTIESMIKGEPSGVIFFDYCIAIKHGIKTEKLLKKDKSKMGEIEFQQEYQNIPFGENGDAYFKLELFSKNRSIKKVFLPKENASIKKNKYAIPKVNGEKRVLSIDIATRKGKKNDNTIITCIRAIPTKQGYKREKVYMESHQGEHTGRQALRIKQLYYDFEADYIVLDLQNAGFTVFERLADITKDDEAGVEYAGFTVMEHKTIQKKLSDEMLEKTLDPNSIPCIYPIMADLKKNSDIATKFRDDLKRGIISIPVDQIDAEEYLNNNDKDFKESENIEYKSKFLYPYAQFQEAINETIALNYSVVNGNIKIEEQGSNRKDRYTSMSYGNYFISILDIDLLKKVEEHNNWGDYFITGSKWV